MRIGIFGGTFNPIHFGHLRAVEEVRQAVDLDKVFFIPSGYPALKTWDLEEASHRYRMTAISVKDNPYFEVLDIECRVPGRSYSVDTLSELNAQYPDEEFFFILGIDAFMDLPEWRMPEEIIGLSEFIVISRPQYSFMDVISSPYLNPEAVKEGLLRLDGKETSIFRSSLRSGRSIIFTSLTQMDISATAIRKLLRDGKSVKYLLPQDVESYIISNGLYLARIERGQKPEGGSGLKQQKQSH